MANTPDQDDTAGHAQEVLSYIEAAIASLRYGTLALTIHDGRVVQIERTEKLRLDPPAASEKRRHDATGQRPPKG